MTNRFGHNTGTYNWKERKQILNFLNKWLKSNAIGWHCFRRWLNVLKLFWLNTCDQVHSNTHTNQRHQHFFQFCFGSSTLQIELFRANFLITFFDRFNSTYEVWLNGWWVGDCESGTQIRCDRENDQRHTDCYASYSFGYGSGASGNVQCCHSIRKVCEQNWMEERVREDP